MLRISDFMHRVTTRTVSAVALSAALALGLGSPIVQAQSRHDGDLATAQSTFLIQSAIFNGYGAGYERGAADSRSGASFDSQYGDTYQQATSGYDTDMGSAVQYQDGFRTAFSQGYSDAFRGRERDPESTVPPVRPVRRSELPAWYNQNVPLGTGPSSNGRDVFNVAQTNGYNAGYTRGIEDKNRRAAYDYQNDGTYQSAEQGYDERSGDRSTYQSAFRLVFARGYSDGYNGRDRYSDLGQISDYDDRRDPAPRRLSSYDILQIATANGYHEGFERGISSRNARQSSAYKRDEAYQRATGGYDNNWNVARAYQTSFRQGYARGFSDGYYRRTRNNVYEGTYNERRTSGYNYGYDSNDRGDRRQVSGDPNSLGRRSAETGYRDGYDRGQYDQRSGVKTPNPQGHGAYQFGLDGWVEDMGDRSAYQSNFREYFVHGYQDGFNGRTANFAFRP